MEHMSKRTLQIQCPSFVAPTVLASPFVRSSHTPLNRSAKSDLLGNLRHSTTLRMSNEQPWMESNKLTIFIDMLQSTSSSQTHSRNQSTQICSSAKNPSNLVDNNPVCHDVHETNDQAALMLRQNHETDLCDPCLPPSPLLSSLYFTVGSNPPNYPPMHYASAKLVSVGLPILNHLRYLHTQQSKPNYPRVIIIVRRIAHFAFSIALFFNPFK